MTPAPQLLSEQLAILKRELIQTGSLTAYPYDWQTPAITEKAAHDSMIDWADTALGFHYIAFPWATLFDRMDQWSANLPDMLRELGRLCRELPGGGGRVATVVQHIRADRYMRFYKACGITDLFWSHCTHSRREIDGIRVHPFPLYPAQTATLGETPDLHAPRKYLANFIGAYNPKVYLTDVREHIFADAGTADDLLIIKREGWHFDRTVYDEQMKGITPDEARLQAEERNKTEYLDAIRHSAFTLCPSGSGPNSIRIGEALALASIPVILTRELALPGAPALWEEACLIEEDSVQGYRRALERARAMTPDELRRKQAATQALYKDFAPDAYGRYILSVMQGA